MLLVEEQEDKGREYMEFWFNGVLVPRGVCRGEMGRDTVGEDTGGVSVDVGVVTASEGCVLIGVLVVMDEDVVHAGMSVDATGREVED
ncbi:hypothetical protein NDU88_004122 [Pleurodeles waltl]|uniref:Uncharacterized protein n=1 Tax=Pleurodeles waltl TaxID=8319 RepID=A0AAV7WUM1_PLEWA|nr:hypothetical protein NDU88_004122 [Pleurodeles waltl]